MNDLQEVVTAGTLASFERERVSKQVEPLRWSIEKELVAERLALTGMRKSDIAKELKIPLSAINTWLKHPEFQQLIADLVMEKASTMKATALKYLVKHLDARAELAEQHGWETYSNKDVLDVHAEIRKTTGEDRAADSSYTSLLEKLVTSSMKQQITIIQQPAEDK